MKKLFTHFLIFTTFILFSFNVYSKTSTWVGLGANTDWTTAENWDAVPVANDDIVIPATFTATVSTLVTTIRNLKVTGKILITSTGTINILSNATTATSLPFVDLSGGEIENNGTLTITEGLTTQVATISAMKLGNSGSIAAKFTSTGTFSIDLSVRTIIPTQVIDLNAATGNTATFTLGGTVNLNLPSQSRFLRTSSGSAILDGTYTIGSTGSPRNIRFLNVATSGTAVTIASTANITLFTSNNEANNVGGVISINPTNGASFTNNGQITINGGTGSVCGLYFNQSGNPPTGDAIFTNAGTFTLNGSFSSPIMVRNSVGRNFFINNLGAVINVYNPVTPETQAIQTSTTTTPLTFNNNGVINVSQSPSITILAQASTTKNPSNGGTINYNTTLPVELIDFKLVKNFSSIKLTWNVASETNCDYYAVERSTDGKNFILVGKIFSQDKVKFPYQYSLSDFNPARGRNYYRLLQYDKDGTENKIGLLTTEFGLQNKIEPILYPNPTVASSFSINLNQTNLNDADIKIVDMKGAIIFNKRLKAEVSKVTVNLANKPQPGIYLVYINNANSLKLIVE